MEPREEIQQQMWEFVYGLLPEPEARALRRQIQRDPTTARLHAEIQRQSEIVAEAARWNEPPLDFSGLTCADRHDKEAPRPAIGSFRRRVRRKTARHEPGGLLLRVATLLMIAFVGWSYLKPDSPLRPATYQTARERLEASSVQVHLLGTPQITENAPRDVAVLTRGLDGQPRPATVHYRVVADSDQLLVEGRASSDEDGWLPITVPAEVASDRLRLEVQTVGLEDLPPVSYTFAVRPPRLVTHLLATPAKGAPGEKVRYRTVVLGADDVRGKPGVRVRIELRDPDDRLVRGWPQEGTTERGVFHGAFRIPENLAEGTYQWVIRSPEGLFAETRREFVVGTASPSVRPIVRESLASRIATAAGTIRVSFFPESGELVGGVPNRVYFQAVDEKGGPVRLEGQVLDEQDGEIARLQTRQAGRGTFEWSPEPGKPYRLRVTDPPGAQEEPRLPAAHPSRSVTWTVASGVVSDGVPLTVRSTRGDERLMLTATSRSRVVGQWQLSDSWTERGDGGWEQTVTLPLADAAEGVMRLTAYDLSACPPDPVAERLFYRPPRQHLAVQVDGMDSASADGRLRGTVEIRDESGRPREAVLGLRIVAASRSAAGAGSARGLAEDFWLVGDLPAPVGLDHPDRDPFMPEPAAVEALDLLLGAQPGRLPERSERWLADNSSAVRQRTARALAAIRTARHAELRRTGMLIFAGAFLLLAGTFACRWWRPVGNLRREVPQGAIASLGLVLGLIALTAQIDPRGRLTWSTVPGEIPQVAQLDTAPPTVDEFSATERVAPERMPAEPATGPRPSAPPAPAPRRAEPPVAELQDQDEAVLSARGARERRLAEPRGAVPSPPSEAIEEPAFEAELSRDAPSARMAARPEPAERRGDTARDELAEPAPDVPRDGRAAAPPEPEPVLLWEPALVTDRKGRAAFAFRLPEHSGPFRLEIDAHGAGRIGTFQTNITVGNRE